MRTILLAILFLFILLSSCKSVQKVPDVPTTPMPPINAEMLETHWKLTVLMGKPVVLSENNKKEIFIVLRKEENNVQGFSGCNYIMGKYEMNEGNRISFSAMASTMMACPDMDIETEFNEMLGVIDNYSLNGSTMTLNKAKMAPMAIFEAVSMK